MKTRFSSLRLLIIIPVVLLLTGCTTYRNSLPEDPTLSEDSRIISTPIPTITLTSTPIPTNGMTITPTVTPTVAPTVTPEPTDTSEPTLTPVSVSSTPAHTKAATASTSKTTPKPSKTPTPKPTKAPVSAGEYVTYGMTMDEVLRIMGEPRFQKYDSMHHTYVDTLHYYEIKNDVYGDILATIYLAKENSNEPTVVGWDIQKDGARISDGYENNVDGTFTLGSSFKEVSKVMDTPRYIQLYHIGPYGGGTYMIYKGGSRIEYDHNFKVIGWENKSGNLKVQWGAKKPTNSIITLGSSIEDVIKSFGTPDEVEARDAYAGKPRYLTYYFSAGKTILKFDDDLKLVEWLDKDKMNIYLGDKDPEAAKVKVGTSLEDLIRAKGTPDSLETFSTSFKPRRLTYGKVSYYISHAYGSGVVDMIEK